MSEWGRCVGDGDSLTVTIRLWDVATRKERATLKGHTDIVLSLAFSPGGKTLASADGHGRVKLWDISGVKKSDK